MKFLDDLPFLGWFGVTICLFYFFSYHGLDTIACSDSELFWKSESFRHLVGFLGWGIGTSQGLYLHRITLGGYQCIKRASKPWCQCSSGPKQDIVLLFSFDTYQCSFLIKEDRKCKLTTKNLALHMKYFTWISLSLGFVTFSFLLSSCFFFCLHICIRTFLFRKGN
jgi:hypothetical protein